jgi:hypothetical protein
MARRRRGDDSVWEQVWRERIDAWRTSGQTQRRFCCSQRLGECEFSSWKARLSQREKVESESSLASVVGPAGSPREVLAWTEVAWPAVETPAAEAEATSESSGFEIVLPRGWSVRLGSGFEAEPLRRLLGVLEGFTC